MKHHLGYVGAAVTLALALVACDSGGTAAGSDTTASCTKMASQGCHDTEIYWFDSCGQVDHVATYCTAPETCVEEQDGTPRCEDPAASCTPDAEVRCSGPDVYRYDSCGNRGDLVELCGVGTTCLDDADGQGDPGCAVPPCTDDGGCDQGEYCETSTGICVDQVCSPFANVCVDGEVHECAPNGSGTTPKTTCTDGERCTDGPGGAGCRCVAADYTACYDGDVYWFDSCGAREQRYEQCTAPAACVDGDGASCVNGGCTQNSHCAPDQWCDVGSGECEDDTCEPFAGLCQDGQALRCRVDGSEYEVIDTCTGGEVCTVGASGATCSCQVNAALGCYGGDVYHYDSCGVRGTRSVDCSAPEACVDAGGAIACGLPTSCSDDGDCYPTSWCDSLAGECKPDVCQATGTSCADGQVVSCLPNGSGFQVHDTCVGGEVCVAGTNGASCKCEINHHVGCHNGEVYSFDSCGTPKTIQENCTAPEVCVAGAGTAECALPPVCGSNADCYASQWCELETGVCRPDVCAAGPSFCNGQLVQRCVVGGSGFETLDTCVGGEVCVDGSSGAQCKCTVGGFLGCHNTDIYNFDSCGTPKTIASYCTTPEICQLGSDGQPFCGEPVTCTADDQCAAGRYCDVDHCVDRVCTPAQRECQGDTLLRCNDRGSAWEVHDLCVGGEVCASASGGLLTCKCEANAYQGCWNGNVERFDSCGNPTSVAQSCPLQSPCQERATGPECRSIYACDTDGDCADDEFCELDACQPRVCTAGERFCAGQTIRECNANGSDSVVVTDCGAGELCGVTASGPQCGCVPDASVGCGADGDVHSFDSCGREGATLQACASPLICVPAGIGAACSDAGSCGSDCTCATEGTQACYYGDLYEVSSCNEPVVLVEDCPGQILCNSIGGAPACRSSVEAPDATYYDRSCGLVHQIEHPTTLDADCRCSNNRVPSAGIPECVSAQYLDPAVSFGSGPRVRPLAQPHINGGFFDAAARELVVGVDWSSSGHPDSGFVLAVNVDSGDRRIISGGYEAGGAFSETGVGPSLHNVIDVRPGPDGKLYALSVPGSSVDLEIVRVDPTTGDRTLVWRAQDPDFAQCPSGDPARLGAQVNDRGFAVDDQGRFYLPFTNTSPYGEGVGVVRIAANGGACSFVTRSGAQSLNDYHGQDVGGGYLFDRGRYQGFTLEDGALWAIQNAYLTLVRVDLATGERTRVSTASTSAGVLGGGPTGAAGIGLRWVVYDEGRDLWWASGTFNRRMLTAVDPTTGDRTEAYCQQTNPERPWREMCLGGALVAGYQNEGGMWVDPVSGDLLIAHENFTIVRVDLVHGNSIRVSL